jgi:hypothetical protein
MDDQAFDGVFYTPATTWTIFKAPDLESIESGFKTLEHAERRVAELEAEDPALTGAFQIGEWPPPATGAAAGAA